MTPDLHSPTAPDAEPVPSVPTPSSRVPSIWHRPISYRAQCWVAWVGLTAFGIRGAVAMIHGGDADVERVAAICLSVAWGIDLLRGRSVER